jgi:hypothetical protein
LHQLATNGMDPSNVNFPTHLRNIIASLIPWSMFIKIKIMLLYQA